MSERAERYYTDRTNEFADIWQGPIPEIFKKPRRILTPGKYVSAFQAVTDGLILALRPVEPFLISGVPGVFEARNQHLSAPEWERIKGLPRNSTAHTLKQHAEGKLGKTLLKGLKPNESIYLEALCRDDVVPMEDVWRRTTAAPTNPPKIEEDSAQAYFLARVIDEGSVCTRATFTVTWATYYDGFNVARQEQTYRESLTPRYLSDALLPNEIEALPPLTLV